MSKDNIYKYIKWGIILIVIILLLREGCSVYNTLLKANTLKSDTIYIHKIDTIFPPKEPIQFKEIHVPKPYFIHDTIVRINGRDTCTNIKIYEDSLIDGNINIYYKDYVAQGELLGKDLSYKLKVPLRITDSKTVTISVPTMYPPVFQIDAGVIAGSNIFAPKVGVSYKRHTISAGYNLTNRQPVLEYRFALFRK